MESNDSVPAEIGVDQVDQLRKSEEDFLLLDCREPQEIAMVMIEGAMHIPMQQTPSRVGELESYRDKRIVVYCHHGMRSMQVAQWLRGQGFGQAQSMANGIDGWATAIDPNMIRY